MEQKPKANNDLENLFSSIGLKDLYQAAKDFNKDASKIFKNELIAKEVKKYRLKKK